MKTLFLIILLSFVAFGQPNIPTVNGWYYVQGIAPIDILATKTFFSNTSTSQIFETHGKTLNSGLPGNPYWNFQTTWNKDFPNSFSVPDTIFIDSRFVSGEQNIKAINVFIAFQSNDRYYFIGRIDENKNIPLDSKWKTLHWGELQPVKEFGLLSFLRFYIAFQFSTEDSCYTGGLVEVKNLRGKYSYGDVVIFDRFSNINSVPEKMIPSGFVLEQNYPNPFNPSTTISFSLPWTQFITLKIYDILGIEISTLVNEEKLPGNYKVTFNGSNLSSGVYYYQMKAGQFVETKKLILLK